MKNGEDSMRKPHCQGTRNMETSLFLFPQRPPRPASSAGAGGCHQLESALPNVDQGASPVQLQIDGLQCASCG